MDKFTRTWIIDNALEVVQEYKKGILTIRGLHYRLVSRGMTNTQQHYKRVVGAMKKARWDELIPFDTFADNDREAIGETDFEETNPEDAAENSMDSINFWLNNYFKNRWENQKYYPEVFIEKKALQGVFGEPCKDMDVSLSPCKGYPSLTFLYEASLRFKTARDLGKVPIILYFGDYDPSGEDIPRSIAANLWDMDVEVEVRRIALMEAQVLEWELPPAPAKTTDSRTANWDGLGQVELDAVEPRELRELCRVAIESIFDRGAYKDLRESQVEEETEYKAILKKYINEELK